LQGITGTDHSILKTQVVTEYVFSMTKRSTNYVKLKTVTGYLCAVSLSFETTMFLLLLLKALKFPAA
jgi:hypothetical protein